MENRRLKNITLKLKLYFVKDCIEVFFFFIIIFLRYQMSLVYYSFLWETHTTIPKCSQFSALYSKWIENIYLLDLIEVLIGGNTRWLQYLFCVHFHCTIHFKEWYNIVLFHIPHCETTLFQLCVCKKENTEMQ